MKLWRFSDPCDPAFAQAGRRGSWSESPGVCPECTGSRQHRIPPLVLEWQPGADVVGDFVWVGPDLACRRQVIEALSARFLGPVGGPVEMAQDAKVRRTPRAKSRVWLPYEGPELRELLTDVIVPFDPKRSSVRVEKVCSTCGRVFRAVDGLEHWKTTWDVKRRQGTRKKIPRPPGCGYLVADADRGDAGIFSPIDDEIGVVMLCTDEVKRFIEAQHPTNISFLEAGETF
jgi:hypothetical protein